MPIILATRFVPGAHLLLPASAHGMCEGLSIGRLLPARSESLLARSTANAEPGNGPFSMFPMPSVLPPAGC
ncbi:uncharacterized protein P884DRAFT_257337 [Thermothelomyces heterothallicus CBS 202.75]|uniref:uncharacterized protein n=1 Tax=Thermothelomyces heterothallicus CBS 202.75 TaxID=1149848 RepID=UPI0037435741